MQYDIATPPDWPESVLVGDVINVGEPATVCTVTALPPESEVYQGLRIPVAHPRTISAEQIEMVRKYHEVFPFTPKADDALGHALLYLITGDAASADKAIALLMAWTIPEANLHGNSQDHYRWNTWASRVFDWCFDRMTEAQRAEFIARYNHYALCNQDPNTWKPGATAIWPDKIVNGELVTLWANNYVLGRWRNAILWGLASYHESKPEAQATLDYALGYRWEKMIEYAHTTGAGGVTQEGAVYGDAQLGDPIAPLIACRNLGRDLYAENPGFREMAEWLLHVTSNVPVYDRTGTKTNYQVYTFGDDEQSLGYPAADGSRWLQTNKANANRADFMSVVMRMDHAIAGKARQWLNTVGNAYQAWWLRATEPEVLPEEYVLPLDKYAPGCQHLHCRSSNEPGAMEVLFQLGNYSGAGHLHKDQGTFQIRYKGRWVTHESCGYSNWYVGLNGIDLIKYLDHAPHNSLVIDGKVFSPTFPRGNVAVFNVQMEPEYATASVNLTQWMRSRRDTLDNVRLVSCVRHFAFIRKLNALVIVDAIEMTEPDVPKVFLLHCENPPTVTGQESVGTTGNVEWRNQCLTQPEPTYFVTNERPATGATNSALYQYRLEQTHLGPAASLLANVLQVCEVGEPGLAAVLNPDLSIGISHAARGSALVRYSPGGLSVEG